MKKIIFAFTTILLSTTLLYFLSNYNQFKIYIFEGYDESFFVSGNATFSKKIHLLNINTLRYRKEDINLKRVKISLIAKINGKERLIYARKNEPDGLFSLTEYLKSYSFTLTEQYGYNESFPPEITKKFADIIYLKIEMTDEFDKEYINNIKIKSQVYSNNRWVYQKSPAQ